MRSIKHLWITRVRQIRRSDRKQQSNYSTIKRRTALTSNASQKGNKWTQGNENVSICIAAFINRLLFGDTGVICDAKFISSIQHLYSRPIWTWAVTTNSFVCDDVRRGKTKKKPTKCWHFDSFHQSNTHRIFPISSCTRRIFPFIQRVCVLHFTISFRSTFSVCNRGGKCFFLSFSKNLFQGKGNRKSSRLNRSYSSDVWKMGNHKIETEAT